MLSKRDITDTTCPAIPPATCPDIHSPNLPELGLKGTGTPEKLQEILIQNPDGKEVPEHEIWRVPNPHSGLVATTYNPWKSHLATIIM